MHFRQAILAIDDKTYLLKPNRANSFDELYVDFQQTTQQDGERYSIFLHPKQDIVVQRLEVQFDLQLEPHSRIFANGYQSSSESRMMGLQEGIPRLRKFARKYLGNFGDEMIPDIPRGAGYLHSWTYTTVDGRRSTVDGAAMVLLAGSLSERTGFTLFLYDEHNAVLTVRKNLDNLQLAHSFPALDFWVGQGSEQAVFDRYFQAMELEPPLAEPALGWTSRYRHTHISEKILLQDLDNVASSGQTFTYFQIDDGWQTAAGDWLSVKPEFPGGMGRMAGAIRTKGLQPGIWLAPFVASAKSELVKRNPTWLLKDGNGKPLKAGWNPNWSGWFYALDFYNPQVRDYLSGVFHVMRDTWNFELFKLDFLFAACLAPPPGKTRGQVMYEAMEFLRQQAGNKKILACGVPLGAAFGQVDYCRIGPDIQPSGEHRFLTFLRFRERPGTINSLRSTIARYPLNDRAFHNDPDGFSLHSDQKRKAALRHTVLTINGLLGDSLFISDDLNECTHKQISELETALGWRGVHVQSIREIVPDVYGITFLKNAPGLSLDSYMLYANLNARPVQIETKPNSWMTLKRFETIVLGDPAPDP